MFWSFLTAAVFGTTGIYMLAKGHYAATRYMAVIPLLVMAVELIFCETMNTGGYPLFTVILTAARLGMLVCCRKAMKADAAKARNFARRQKVWRRIAMTAPQACVVESTRQGDKIRRIA